MMERIKRRMVTVNSLEVMRRTFKVGLVMSEETEADLEFDLGMLRDVNLLSDNAQQSISSQTAREVILINYSRFSLRFHYALYVHPMLFIQEIQKRQQATTSRAITKR